MPNEENSQSGVDRRLRIVIVASRTRSLTNFRFHLLKAMAEAGHEVIAFAPEDDEYVIEELKSIGVGFEVLPMTPTGLNPLDDIRTTAVLWRRLRELAPQVVLPYTMKPVIYGCLAARWAGVPRRFALITGLGYVFTDPDPPLRVALLRRLAVFLYRRSLAGIDRVFAYNEADAEVIRRHRFLRNPARLSVVPGSGVDLDRFTPSAPPLEPPTFLMVARILRDKGVVEFAQASEIVRRRYPQARMQLLGPTDPNPSAISEGELRDWVASGSIEYLGETSDVRPYLARCTVFVLPSYREGLPRSVLEAMASGRPVITTDAPGCRDTVVHDFNGKIVPVRDATALAAAMESFILNPDQAVTMGRNSRDLVSRRFDVHQVNRRLLADMLLSHQSVR
jgi:glycosyltransferase involved in cell wall biosynthesis